MLRSVAGVIVGYLVFGVTASFLFDVTGRDPHAAQGPTFLILSTICGMAVAGVGGFLAGTISGRRPLLHAAVVSGIIAIAAIVSLITRPEGSLMWSQLVALFLMAPCALAGGALRGRTTARGRG
jgi:peptidoglycan/LPS O-acetylase OafA/YrhL